MWVSFRRRNIPVLRNSLARCNARHLRIKHLIQFILVDPVCNNALANRAALLCRALRRVNRLCSRTVSGTAYRFRHGSTLCSPTVEKILCRSPFRSGHMSAIFARLRNKGKRELRGWKPQVSTLLCARAASAHFPLRCSEKLPARKGRTRLRQFAYPAQPVLKKAAAR